MFKLAANIFSNLSRTPATRRYPFEKREAPSITRGRLDIEIEKCIFCGACQKRCPANAIAVTREPKSWTLNPYACIICGYCVEVCPTKCLHLKPDYLPPKA